MDPAVDQEIIIIDLSEVPDAERSLQAGDKLLVRFADGSGQMMSPEQLTSLLGGVTDQYGFTPPTGTGKLNQKYFHIKQDERLVDLYQYDESGWGVPRIAGLVLTSATAIPTPKAPTFADFQDTQAGGSVRLVPATGLSFEDYLYKVGSNSDYGPAPLDGIITVGDVTAAVYAYSKRTATRNQSQAGISNTFTAYVNPTQGTTTPAAPTFTNFQDTKTGGSVTLVPATGVPISDYLWKIGANGTYATPPADGILNVGNVDGQVFAYSIAKGSRNQSLTGASQTFTSYSEAPTNTTPAAPTFTNFQDTQAGGTVTIVPDSGVSMALVVYALPGSSTFAAAPADGIVTVGNVAGVVQAKSLAGGTYNASAVRSSQAFTVYSAPLPTPDAPTFTNYSPANRTATVAPPAGYTIADLRYVLKNGAVTAVPANGNIPVGNDAVAGGDLVVYVYANASRKEGTHASNEVGYPAVVATPNFNTTYTAKGKGQEPDNQGTSLSLGGELGWLLLLNVPLSSNTDPAQALMNIFEPGGAYIAQVDYNGADSNTVAFAVVNTNTNDTYMNNGVQSKGTIYYNGVMTDGAGTRTGSLKLTNGNVTLT